MLSHETNVNKVLFIKPFFAYMILKLFICAVFVL
jgi:hypothetical protein